jgi:hypothetical protein
LPKLALGAAVALAALSLSPGSAQAACAPGTPAGTCRVTVGGLRYDVTLFTDTYDNNKSKFATAANGGVMPWFGSSGIAESFASAVGTSLGTPNFGSGPYFSYAIGIAAPGWPSARYFNVANNAIEDFNTAGINQFTWAQASEVVPAPLPIFGAGAAFGFSRKLRKRIQGSPRPLGSSQPRA